MLEITTKTKELQGYTWENIPYQMLMDNLEPVILKGAVRDWELVQAGLESNEAAIAYLKRFYTGLKVAAFYGAPELKGRFFYDETATQMNFDSARVPLDEVLDQIQAHLGDAQPPAFYVGSTTLDLFLPGLRQAHNDLLFNHPMFDQNPPLASIWMGNPTLVSAHYDAPNNMACCVAGQRRFTLFPPSQIANLYPGPLEPTPGGQVISMVDFANPDLARFPNFPEAIKHGQIAVLEPGDLLFYPSMWWHQVEATKPFNILVNYWWNTSPKYMGTPMNALEHALLSLRDRPDHEKQAWKAVFDYYIFGDNEQARAHLPPEAWGKLGQIDDMAARQMRASLLQKLNR